MAGLARRFGGGEKIGHHKCPRRSPKDQFSGKTYCGSANRKQNGIHNPDWRLVGITGRFITMTAVGVDAAMNRFREAVVELHCGEHHGRKDRAKEHARLRRLNRAVHRVENAIAENAVPV